jgi:hypothetical protein
MSTDLRVTKSKILTLIVLLLILLFILSGKYIFIGDDLLSAFFNNNIYMYLGVVIVFFIAWILDMKM